jgi:tRNA threonylcarbamoyladenosine biosynthesis protein TsaB
VETSTLMGGVALLDGDSLAGECRLNLAVTHSERLLVAVDHLLAARGWRLGDLGLLAVAMGPGSFTGLRIGVSTMKGLAFATGTPLVGVPTLDALAWTLPFASPAVCPLLDAKKGEVYTALYRTETGRLERLSDYRAQPPEAWAEELARSETGPIVFLGDGVTPYAPILARVLGDRACFAPPSHRLPSAATVGELGQRILARGETVDPATLIPLYVRRSEAELRSERHVGHPH